LRWIPTALQLQKLRISCLYRHAQQNKEYCSILVRGGGSREWVEDCVFKNPEDITSGLSLLVRDGVYKESY